MDKIVNWLSVAMLTLYTLFIVLLLASVQLCSGVVSTNFLFPVCDADTGVSALIFYGVAGLGLWGISGAYLLFLYTQRNKISSTSILFTVSRIVSLLGFLAPVLLIMLIAFSR